MLVVVVGGEVVEYGLIGVLVPLMTWGNGGRMARVGEAWKARRAMGVRWASSWRDSRAGRNEVAIVCVCG